MAGKNGKFHVNEKGEVHPCSAQGNCPLKGPDGEKAVHYDTPEEATKGAEETLARVHGGSMPQKTKKTSQVAPEKTVAMKAATRAKAAEDRMNKMHKDFHTLGSAPSQEKFMKAQQDLEATLGTPLPTFSPAEDPWASQADPLKQRQTLQAYSRDAVTHLQAPRQKIMDEASKEAKSLQESLDALNKAVPPEPSVKSTPRATVKAHGYVAEKGKLMEAYTVTPLADLKAGQGRTPLKERTVHLGGTEGLSTDTKTKLAAALGHHARGATAAPSAVVASKAQAEDIAGFKDTGADPAPFGSVLASGIDHTKMGVSFKGHAKDWDARTKSVYFAAAGKSYAGDRVKAVKAQLKFLEKNPTWQAWPK